MDDAVRRMGGCLLCGGKVRRSRRQGTLERLCVWGSPWRCHQCRHRFFRYRFRRWAPMAALLAVAVFVAVTLVAAKVVDSRTLDKAQIEAAKATADE